ncbi:MAG: UDP-N-acetylglucosamine 2-epimerase [Bacteriovorax sp. MedPE-SWde]|nr:MAG: UDP-N-acetylglucosamine 2-epimerase [Bacteriovorax sp. MedPE-SWde]
MKRFKVLTVVGTRPEIIRLSCVISELQSNPAIDHVLVHTGQNYDYELNQIFFDDLQIEKPKHFLESATGTALGTIGNVITKLEDILKAEKPDSLLVLGDTNSCFAALSAKLLKIPVFHMEAGNRCFDQRVPEEINRKVVDHISDINLCYSDIAREYLLREGIPPERVIKTGSPMFEVLKKYRNDIGKSKILSTLDLEKGKYFLVSSHRAENVDTEKGIRDFATLLQNLERHYNLPVIVSTHPRTKNKLAAIDVEFSNNISFLKPFGFFDYINLQTNSKVTLSDSGTISEESSILNFSALNLRAAHERPEAMEEGTVIMTGYNWERILQAITSISEDSQENYHIVKDYSLDNVSKKVCRIMLSYKDFVKQKVWYEFD